MIAKRYSIEQLKEMPPIYNVSCLKKNATKGLLATYDIIIATSRHTEVVCLLEKR
jgi:hypothetical protein